MSQKDYEHKIEKEMGEPKPKQCENDCLKFVDTIIELTSKISGIESKFEQFEKHTLQNLKEPNLDVDLESDKSKHDDKFEITVETSNKFECLQNQNAQECNKSEPYVERADLHTLVAKKEENNKRETMDMCIVGSSVTRHINPQIMYKTKKVHVAQLQDKTVQGAKEFIETVEMEAGIVLYQIGSNDLHKKQQ